jgi:DNA-binding winged helix-turn-helix (wHTH) protein
MPTATARRYRFGDAELDVQNLRLTVGGTIRTLEPKSFRLLVFLIENRARIVGKEEIMAAIWPDTAVTDNALTRVITQIRKALDDDAKEPKYLETVPTVGYRFMRDYPVHTGLCYNFSCRDRVSVIRHRCNDHNWPEPKGRA